MNDKISTKNISLRSIPYPYKAMLTICSDLDETPNLSTYLEIARFLNTDEVTRMGEGLSLEVANSIYFNMPQNQFSYWNTDEKGRDIIRILIRSGHIDCLHSYGDLADSRRHAETALEELIKYNCKLKVWVDHAQAPTNLGPDIMRGRGDIPGNKAYHADLTINYGIKYVWIGRVTNMIGQNVQKNFSGIWTPKHPVASFKTLFKEMAKAILAQAGNKKYAMHHQNKLLRDYKLKDGREVIEFMRSTFHWGGISYDDTAEGLKDIFTQQNLDLLVKRKGVSIIYTHLGKLKSDLKFSNETISALKLLKRYYEEKKILVTTTYRVLNHVNMLNSIKWSVTQDDNTITILIYTDRTMSDLQGLSFSIPSDKPVSVKINGKIMDDRFIRGNASTGKRYITLPWQRLEFPSL